jgi:recombination protein RecR
MLPPEIQNFVDSFSKLPAIGPRMATRLSFFIASLPEHEQSRIREALNGLKTLDRCPRCFFIKPRAEKMCGICTNKKRDFHIVAIVEKDTDVFSIEKMGGFSGHYCVIGELDHRNPLGETQKQRLQSLKNRIVKESENGAGIEIIIALGPNTFGDFVSELIRQGFKDTHAKITRLGRGIPTGGDIEFADEETLRNSLENRK